MKKKDKKISDNKSGHSRFGGIRVSLIGAYLIPVVLIIILGTLSYSRASDAIVKNYKAATSNTIQKTAEYYNLMMQGIDAKSQKLANNNVMRGYYSGDYKESRNDENINYSIINSNLLSEKTSDANINSICVLAPYGKSLTTNGVIEPTAYSQLIETEEGKNILASSNVQSIWTGYHNFLDDYLKISKNAYGIALSRQIISNKMETIGVLIMDISSAALQTPLKTIELPEGSQCAFITSDGREITAEGENAKAVFYGQDFYNTAVKSNEVSGLQYASYQGSTYLFIYSKIGVNNSMLCTLIPKSVIIKQADGIKMVTFIVVAIAIVLAILVGIILASGIGSAIRNVNAVIKRAEEGDLTVTVNTKRKDEFRLLSKHILGMLTGMKALVKRTANVSDTITESAESVAAAATQLVESAKSITEVVEHIEAGIEQQAEDAQNCLKKMNELDEKINHVNTSTEQITEFADSTRSIVENGIVTMDELGTKSKATFRITKEVIENIEQLGEESAAIGGITNTINEIASQTNLLALNASIEAARAGDAGKGFAVVADEIRKLAEASVKASEKIDAIVGSINQRTKETVKTANDAEEIVSSQETALQNTVQVFNEIISHVEGLSGNIDDISIRIRDIEEAKNETLNAISNISAVLEETASASVEVQSAAESQLSATKYLNDAAGKLREQAFELQNAVSSFKI